MGVGEGLPGGQKRRAQVAAPRPALRCNDSPPRATLVASGLLSRRRRRLLRVLRMQRSSLPGSRFLPSYDIAGPKIRIGVVCFGVALWALWVTPVGASLLYGSVAAVGGLQCAQAWRRQRHWSPLPVVGVTAFGCPFVALLGLRAWGIYLVAVLVGIVAVTVATRTSWAERTSTTLRCGLPIGMAAASIVLTRGDARSVAIVLLVFVSAYEVGDYLVGSGAATPLEGPAAGMIAVGVLTFAVSIIEPAPFTTSQLWVLGTVVAAACPLGQVAGSALLPSGGAFAPALRRLDSLLVAGPAYLLVTSLQR